MTDLDEAADELYAGAPEEFVARRAELVRLARARQDRPLALAIQALRRPTRTAWLVNLLTRAATVEVTALLDLAPALRDAQARGDGAALRDLSTRRRRSIDALTRRAGELGRAHQHPPVEASLDEVAATLQAALADPEVAEQVRRGRLATAVVYGGFGSSSAPNGEDLSAALAASIPSTASAVQGNSEDQACATQQAERRREDQREDQRREDQRRADQRRAERRQAEQRRTELTRRRGEARTALEQARAEADEATEHADALAQQVERLRSELARTEQGQQAAQQAARMARERVRDRRSAIDAAEHAGQEEETDRP